MRVLDVGDIQLKMQAQANVGITPIQVDRTPISSRIASLSRILFRALAAEARRGESATVFDEVCLTGDTRLLEQTAEMRLDGAFSNAERNRNFWDATDFHDREQDP